MNSLKISGIYTVSFMESETDGILIKLTDTDYVPILNNNDYQYENASINNFIAKSYKNKTYFYKFKQLDLDLKKITGYLGTLTNTNFKNLFKYLL